MSVDGGGMHSVGVRQSLEPFFTGGTVCVSEEGGFLFTPCGTLIKITDLSTGRQMKDIGSEESSEVTCMLLEDEGKILIVAYRNLLLRKWNWEEGRQLRAWKSTHKAPVLTMALEDKSGNSNDRLLATGGADFTVRIWDLERECCLQSLIGIGGVVSALRWTVEKRNQRKLYVGNGEGELKLFSVGEGVKKDVQVKKPHGSALISILLFDDKVVTASRDGLIAAFSRKDHGTGYAVQAGVSVYSLETMSADGVAELCGGGRQMKGKNLMLSGGEGGSLCVWDPEKGRKLWSSSMSGEALADIQQILIWNSMLSCALVNADHNILFLDSSMTVEGQLVGNNDEVLCLAFTGKEEVVVGTNSPAVRFYSLQDGRCSLLDGHSDAVLCVDVATWNKSLFVTGSKDNSIILWRITPDRKGAAKVGIASGHTNNVSGVKLSKSKGDLLLSVSNDSTVKLWKLPTVFSEEKEPKITRLTASATMVAHDKDITCVDIAPNDKLVATGSMDKSVKLWKVKERKLLEFDGMITGHQRGIWDLSFSTSDQVLATSSGDCTIKIFALSDLSCVKTLEGHQSAVLKVMFLNNGLELLSADSGGLLKVWSVRTSQCINTYDKHEDKIWAVNVDREGSQIGSGGADSRVLIWKDTTEEESVEKAKQHAEIATQEQGLENLMNRKEMDRALPLAIKLSRKFTTLQIIEQLIEDEEKLKEAIHALDEEKVVSLLSYVKDWNTNSRNAEIAQKVLRVLLCLYTPQKLIQLPNSKDLLEVLISYTDRHFERLSRLKQQSRFLEYTWQCMRLPDSIEK